MRRSQSQGGVGDPPEPLGFRPPPAGRRGDSCGGRLSLRSQFPGMNRLNERERGQRQYVDRRKTIVAELIRKVQRTSRRSSVSDDRKESSMVETSFDRSTSYEVAVMLRGGPDFGRGRTLNLI